MASFMWIQGLYRGCLGATTQVIVNQLAKENRKWNGHGDCTVRATDVQEGCRG